MHPCFPVSAVPVRFQFPFRTVFPSVQVYRLKPDHLMVMAMMQLAVELQDHLSKQPLGLHPGFPPE